MVKDLLPSDPATVGPYRLLGRLGQGGMGTVYLARSPGGRLVAAQRVSLEPSKRRMQSLARMGAYRTWATFYICRVGVEAAPWMELERELRETAAGWSEQGEVLWGVSTLTAHGLVVRCMARSGRDVLPGLHAIWRAAKWRMYGREAVAPRKVN